MTESIHPFEHHDLRGAILRLIDDEPHDLHGLLDENRPLPEARSLPLSYTCCFVEHGGRRIMIDGGINAEKVSAQISSLGVRADSIDWVLITHGDRDHVGGLLTRDHGLTFPNACHVIDAGLWTAFSEPGALDHLEEERRTFYLDLIEQLQTVIHPVSDEEEQVAEGVRFLSAPGHRVGHAVYEIETSESPFLHLGDLALHPLFLENPAWHVADEDQEQAEESRKRIANRACQHRALIAASHFPWPGLGSVRSQGERFVWEETA